MTNSVRNAWLLVGLLVGVQVEAQVFKGKNPITWPYGGKPDSTRYEMGMDLYPLDFDSLATFGSVEFHDLARFKKARFHRGASFRYSQFYDKVSFFGAQFHGGTSFRNAQFRHHSKVDFWAAQFHEGVLFENAIFHSPYGGVKFDWAKFDAFVSFKGTVFKATVSFSDTQFKRGVDLREARFDSVDFLALGGMTYPEGQLRVYWDQIKGASHPRIVYSLRSWDEAANFRNRSSHYTRIDILYRQLRDNYLKQGEQASADAVMYELGWQRDLILREWHWRLYGWVFGYGYQPWRFILFVVAPFILGFASLWGTKYYAVLENQVFKDYFEKDVNIACTSQKGSKSLRYGKVWYSVIFSASVSIGLRFKKEWVVHYGYFLYWATVQWALGIGLYIAFALLAKGHRLGYIKELLGL